MKKSVKVIFGFLLVFIFALVYFNSGSVSAAVDPCQANQGDTCSVGGTCEANGAGTVMVETVVEDNARYMYGNGEILSWSGPPWSITLQDGGTYCPSSFSKAYIFDAGTTIRYCQISDGVDVYMCGASTGSTCPNGVINSGEQCDDANFINTDACLSTCQSATCGDGFVRSGVEECDDGNTVNGDGCSSTCQIEVTNTCSENDGGNYKNIAGTVTYNGVAYKDKCGASNTIMEYYCSGTSKFSSTSGCDAGYSCATDANGQGYCRANTCSDTDGGKNYTTKGSVTSNSGSSGTDSCDDSGRILTEYSCGTGNVGTTTTYDCTLNGYTGCSAGACYTTAPTLKSNCDVCTKDADCGSGNCELDFSGNQKRCVPSSGQCAKDAATSCLVDSGTSSATCSGDVLKTCQDTGAWSNPPACTYGCNTAATPDVCNAAPATKVHWAPDGGNLLQILSVLNDVDNTLDNKAALVVENPTNQSDSTATVKKGETSVSTVTLNYFGEYAGITIKNGTESFTTSTFTNDGITSFTVYQTTDGNYVFTTSDGTSDGLTVTTVNNCGNGNLDQGEQCDPPGTTGQCTSIDKSYEGGTWTCDSTCQYDVSSCQVPAGVVCGDSQIDPPEECEGNNPNGESCTSLGYDGGTLDCYPVDSPNECRYDKTGCTLDPSPTCNDGIQNQDETGVDCGGSVCDACEEVQCVDVSFCSNYGTQETCEQDTCSVSGTGVELGPNQDASCYWTGSACDNLVTNSIDGVEIGSCSYVTSGTDTCEDDGFLSYSWTGNWAWATNNKYSSGGESCSILGEGFVMGGDGYCHYDPEGAAVECSTDGQTTVPCPAQIQLSFFEWQNLVGAAILILLVYFFIRTKEKQVKKTKKKSKK